ncbi:MAG: dihydroorotase [Cyanobacteria bacterium SIG30]|nr:dihydroorotase [Cyanobacteria bacterium SIG30]
MNIIETLALIDMHVHFREPGYCEKETILTGLKSAFFGGFKTVCTMPNTNPVCDNVDTLKYILEENKKFEEVKILPICAVTKNLNSKELVDFNSLKENGAIAFSNDGLPILDKDIFKKALESEELIISHLEDEVIEAKWQIEVFKQVLKEGIYVPRLHFAHISKKETLEIIRKEKHNCPNLTVETCPHYFTLTSKDVTDNGIFKMNPKLGSEEDKKAVIEAILDNTIDVISTDHAPHTIDEKLLPYDEAPNGITGLETAFSLTYMTFGLDIAIEKMATNPAKILKIENNKTIKIDLDKMWQVKAQNFKTKCKISPYENMVLKGKILC